MRIIQFIITLSLGLIFFIPSAFSEQFPVVVEADVTAVISSEREGVLKILKVDTGDLIKTNGLIGEVFHKSLVLRKESLQATRRHLRIQVENLGKLNSKGLVTDEEFSKAKMDLDVNQKEIEMTENEITRSKIKAPFSGIIVKRLIQPHEWVKPGQPVVEMYDPSKLKIVADIPAVVAVKLKKSQTNTFYFKDIDREVRGKLFINVPQVDVRSNTIKIIWQVETDTKKTESLLPGMKGMLEI